MPARSNLQFGLAACRSLRADNAFLAGPGLQAAAGQISPTQGKRGLRLCSSYWARLSGCSWLDITYTGEERVNTVYLIWDKVSGCSWLGITYTQEAKVKTVQFILVQAFRMQLARCTYTQEDRVKTVQFIMGQAFRMQLPWLDITYTGEERANTGSRYE